ncbi:MAG: dihydrolipoyl dehydrogenase [Candidatus Pacebacteria bacterium]|nr:dihydrolipoyl dehydrogenase [Candidatus Paceibacterota bacterium]
MSGTYDVIIIGTGPGGYVAAIRAAQLGLSVLCLDRRAVLGGTCLNVGCIPSKALLQSTHKYHAASHDYADHGIKIGGLEVDLELMMERKNSVVGQTTKGIEYLFRKNKIAFIQASARIIDGHSVEATYLDSNESGKVETFTAKEIIIATGSQPIVMPGVEVDGKIVVTSTEALELSSVPRHLVVVGGGYIGLEIGSIWRRLGARVTVVEFKSRIAEALDHDLSRALAKELTAQGMEFLLNSRVEKILIQNGAASLTVIPTEGGEPILLEADVVLISMGRRPSTAGLGLESLGMVMDSRGTIEVDDQYRTHIPSIRAIGDVIAGPMLAHKASEEGIAVAELIAGRHGHVNYDAIPAVVYTSPEVASVGRTEEQLIAENIDYKFGRIPFTASGRARANGNTVGFVKILADARTDRILGAHIIGEDAGGMIAELVLAMEFGATSEDLARTCHAHPTLNETVMEAALAVEQRAIHF